MDERDVLLLKSLCDGPLLVGNLPEGDCFPYEKLELPNESEPLNFRQKLGHLYEDVLALLLGSSPQFDVLAKNLQLRQDAHTTVGELDFLVRDLTDGQLIHLELATKFYLAVETKNGLELPGPDARDNYFRKLQRLREHQLVLTKKYRECLPEEYREESIVVQQLIYGCLFNHVYAEGKTQPEFINSRCRQGRWLSIDQCAEFFSKDAEFRLIPKFLWPVPLDLLEGMELESWTPDESMTRCVMVQVDGSLIPYFIAPAGYPEIRATPIC